MLEGQIHNLIGGTKKTRELYRKGFQRALKELNKQEFEIAVQNYTWKDTNGTEHFGFKLNILPSGEQLSRGEILKLIRSGWDIYDREHDGVMDVEATIHYKRWSSAIGYSYPGTRMTWINTKFWTGTEKQKIARIAANIVHEYMHNLGFTHAYKNNPTRKHTVPYAVGTIVYNNIMEEEDDLQADRVLVCKRNPWTLWLTKRCKWIRK